MTPRAGETWIAARYWSPGGVGIVKGTCTVLLAHVCDGGAAANGYLVAEVGPKHLIALKVDDLLAKVPNPLEDSDT